MFAPLHKLQEALRLFAQETGYPVPLAATLEMPDGIPPLPIPLAATNGGPLVPPKMSRMELVVYQALRSSRDPLTLREIQDATRKSKSGVWSALDTLKRRGLVSKDDNLWSIAEK